MKGAEPVDDLLIRPSMKLIRVAYTLVYSVIFVCVLWYTNDGRVKGVSPWYLLIPALLLFWPLKYHLQRRFTLLTLSGDKLSFQSGIASRSKRVIQLAKVQDVRVHQTLVQRMLHTGDLSLETAGETSLLTMCNVDEPDRIMHAILDSSAKHPLK